VGGLLVAGVEVETVAGELLTCTVPDMPGWMVQ
jgi:hypothetical protein